LIRAQHIWKKIFDRLSWGDVLGAMTETIDQNETNEPKAWDSASQWEQSKELISCLIGEELSGPKTLKSLNSFQLSRSFHAPPL
jgi:hypothetical protein